jgi:uncharacterized protein
VVQVRRILTIDGGGLKGIVPAAILAELETQVNRPLHEYFDLIVGTSTGGIIAAGLAIGMQAQEIVQLYRESGPRIFPTLNWRSRMWLRTAGLVRAKFPTAVLRAELEKHFNDAPIGKATTRLVIPSWDPAGQCVHVWKTRHCGRFRVDHKKPIVDALVSTASAPTYFSSTRASGGTGLIDGGVWANCPMLLAAVEALGVLRWSPDSVQMLALGCVKEDLIPPVDGGWLQWMLPASRLFLQAQASGAIGGTYLLLGDRPNAPQRVFRIEAEAPEDRFSLDGSAELEMLEQMGRALARHHLEVLLPRFFASPAVPFQPLGDDAPDTAIS